MPTYDYECGACGHAFEEFQSMTANVLRKCPDCGKNKLERLIGRGAGILFKGSGFYETDYRSKGYESSASKDSGEATSSGTDKGPGKTPGTSSGKDTPAKSKSPDSGNSSSGD